MTAVAWSASICMPGALGTHVHESSANAFLIATGAAVYWIVMLAAMMAPVLIQPIQFIRGQGLARRRTRATVLFVAGYSVIWTAAGVAMLAVYLPYGALVLLALAAYLTLSWRRRFLASAVLLGPLTLLRPLLAVAGLAWACLEARDAMVALVAAGATTAVLLVEPLAGRRHAARADV